jgi:(2R)-3-sulfolactate dehydrogenase (NADP+)
MAAPCRSFRAKGRRMTEVRTLAEIRATATKAMRGRDATGAWRKRRGLPRGSSKATTFPACGCWPVCWAPDCRTGRAGAAMRCLRHGCAVGPSALPDEAIPRAGRRAADACRAPDPDRARTGVSYTLRWEGAVLRCTPEGVAAEGDVDATGHDCVTLDPAPVAPLRRCRPTGAAGAWRATGRAGEVRGENARARNRGLPRGRGGACRCIGRLTGGHHEGERRRDLERSRAALLAHGAGAFQAETVARAVARAEETGNVICGLYYLESYCVQLLSGRVDGRVEPGRVNARRRAASGSTRASASPNPPSPARCRLALEAARETGWRRWPWRTAHTCTSLGFFTEQIAAEGMIALGMTNASAIVAGPGGRAGAGHEPLRHHDPRPGWPGAACGFLDLRRGAWPDHHGQGRGGADPEGWAVDADGVPRPTPRRRFAGALQSAAGHKGWALGLMVEAFAAGLTGSVNRAT